MKRLLRGMLSRQRLGISGLRVYGKRAQTTIIVAIDPVGPAGSRDPLRPIFPFSDAGASVSSSHRTCFGVCPAEAATHMDTPPALTPGSRPPRTIPTYA